MISLLNYEKKKIANFLLFFMLSFLFSNLDSFAFDPKIKKKILDKGKSITTIAITDLKFLYGVGIDNSGKIIIPNFTDGSIWIYDNDLQNKKKYCIANKNEKYFFKEINKNELCKDTITNKMHDIFLDPEGNLIFTSMNNLILIFNKDYVFKKAINKNFFLKRSSTVISHVDENKNLYISDYGSSKIFIFNKDLKLKSWVGNTIDNNFNDHISLENRLSKINLDRVHAVRNLNNFFYIADTWNHRLIKTDINFNIVGYLGDKGDFKNDNSGWQIKKNRTIKKSDKFGGFNLPIDIQIYKKYLYVSDHSGGIYKINEHGIFQSWLGEDEMGNIKWQKKKTISSLKHFNINKPYSFKIYKKKIYIADREKNLIKILDGYLD